MIVKERKYMYLTLDMLMDPMFWLPLPVVMFFMGGKYSPLSIFTWYRKFWISIGMTDWVKSGDMMDVSDFDMSAPCVDCSTNDHLVWHAEHIR